MGFYSTVPYINPAEKMADSNSLVAQAQTDNAFAEHLMQQAIMGFGDQDAARQLMATSRNMMGLARLIQEFWIEQAKKEKDVMKKQQELVQASQNA